MNTLDSSTFTFKPPLTTWITLPLRTSPLLKASSSFSLTFSAATCLYERATCPSPSFVLITFTVIGSPTCTSSVRSTLGAFVYSLFVMIPSDLYLISTTISSGLTSITVPSTSSPCLIDTLLSSFSNICSKLNSAMLL